MNNENRNSWHSLDNINDRTNVGRRCQRSFQDSGTGEMQNAGIPSAHGKRLAIAVHIALRHGAEARQRESSSPESDAPDENAKDKNQDGVQDNGQGDEGVQAEGVQGARTSSQKAAWCAHCFADGQGWGDEHKSPQTMDVDGSFDDAAGAQRVANEDAERYCARRHKDGREVSPKPGLSYAHATVVAGRIASSCGSTVSKLNDQLPKPWRATMVSVG
jgi:hypothetical protein